MDFTTLMNLYHLSESCRMDLPLSNENQGLKILSLRHVDPDRWEGCLLSRKHGYSKSVTDEYGLYRQDINAFKQTEVHVYRFGLSWIHLQMRFRKGNRAHAITCLKYHILPPSY